MLNFLEVDHSTESNSQLTGLLFAELLRENKRMLDKSIRELDRERVGLQNQEKKLILEIKKAAKQGQMVSLAIGLAHQWADC